MHHNEKWSYLKYFNHLVPGVQAFSGHQALKG